MLIYGLNLIFVVFLALLASRSRSSKESMFLLGIACVSLVLVAGCRNVTVGTDTRAYVSYFADVKSFADVVRMGGVTWEYGFWLLNWLLHFVSDDSAVLLTAIALIVIGCYHRAIVTHSANYCVSFFVFIAMGFYTFFFNGARQGIACAICALAIRPMMQRRFVSYLCCILLACLFHKTAIIMLPVYLVFGNKNDLKTNILYGVAGIAGSLSLQKIVALGSEIDDRYNGYGTAGDGGGYLMVGFSCALTLFFLFFKGRVAVDREKYNFFLNMILFGTVISVVSVLARIDPSGVLRLSTYFNVSAIFLWPIVFKNLPRMPSRLLMGYVFFVGYVFVFALTTQRFSDLVPYTFNPSLPWR